MPKSKGQQRGREIVKQQMAERIEREKKKKTEAQPTTLSRSWWLGLSRDDFYARVRQNESATEQTT